MGEYTGTWIPKHIMECKHLSYSEKFLYAEIASFSTCFASNAHLADRMSTNERQIQRWLANLVNKGFIIKTGFDGRTRQLVPVRDDKSDTSDTTKSTPIDNNIDNSLNIKEIYKEKIVDPDIEDLFRVWERTYGYKPKLPASEKREAKKLIKAYGAANVASVLPAAKFALDKEYAPQITSFKDLWYKWEKLGSWVARQQRTVEKQSVTITE